MKTPIRWAVRWRSKDEPAVILWHACLPLLFKTRREARAWIEERYGYIRDRKDLRDAPHYWRLPKEVRVTVALKEVSR